MSKLEKIASISSKIISAVKSDDAWYVAAGTITGAATIAASYLAGKAAAVAVPCMYNIKCSDDITPELVFGMMAAGTAVFANRLFGSVVADMRLYQTIFRGDRNA